MRASLSDLPQDLELARRVAYGIARVIAEKTILEDPKFLQLDGLGRASARHDMATGMVDSLLDEASGAIRAYEEVARERAA